MWQEEGKLVLGESTIYIAPLLLDGS